VENQLVQPKISFQRLILGSVMVAMVIGLCFLGYYVTRISDPYIQEVISLQGDVDQGEAIFQINCAGCHGANGDGLVGPSLHDVSRRKSKLGLIHQVTSGQTPPMPKFQPNSQEMADLLMFLEQL
jgi:mono/diheme cytochrome c family protein